MVSTETRQRGGNPTNAQKQSAPLPWVSTKAKWQYWGGIPPLLLRQKIEIRSKVSYCNIKCNIKKVSIETYLPNQQLQSSKNACKKIMNRDQYWEADIVQWSPQNFKAAMITRFQWGIENTLETNKKVEKLSTDTENFSKE